LWGLWWDPIKFGECAVLPKIERDGDGAWGLAGREKADVGVDFHSEGRCYITESASRSVPRRLYGQLLLLNLR